jgi:hypothetical protein
MYRATALAAILLFTLCAGVARAAPLSDAALLELVERSPSGAEWRAFARVFPAETRAMLRTTYNDQLRGVPRQVLAQRLADQRKSLIVNNIGFAATAPDAALQHYAAVQAATYRTLRAYSVDLCARAVPTGGVLPDEPVQVRGTIGELGVAQLDLIGAGRDHPQPHDPVSQDDFDAIDAATLAAGASREAVDALRGGMINTQSPQVQCDTMIALNHGLATMAPGPAGRYLALILATDSSTGWSGQMSRPMAIRVIEGRAELGPSLRLFREAFPQEMDAAIDHYIAHSRQHDGQSENDLLKDVNAVIKATKTVGAAPDEDLVAYVKARVALIIALDAADQSACAAELRGTSAPAQYQRPEARNALLTMVGARIRAAADGRLHPVLRAALSPDDVRVLRAAMQAQGMKREVIEAALTVKLGTLPPAEACSGQIDFLNVILSLQPPVLGRVLVRVAE